MPCNATSDRLVSRRSASVIDGQMAGDGGFDPLGIAGETRGYRVGSSYIHISRIFIHIYLGIVCVDYSIRIFIGFNTLYLNTYIIPLFVLILQIRRESCIG